MQAISSKDTDVTADGHASEGWVALDKSEDVVKGAVILAGAQHRWVLPEEVEDQDSGNISAESLRGGTCRSTNHRFDRTLGHDSSMRTSRPLPGMRERPINVNGLACADQGHPRAALDTNDCRIRRLCA
jgi:hypothetical protein